MKHTDEVLERQGDTPIGRVALIFALTVLTIATLTISFVLGIMLRLLALACLIDHTAKLGDQRI